MEKCIFCEIVRGLVPSYKLYEDFHSMAFLDIFPTTKGQCLVIPKVHTSSSFSEAPLDILQETLAVTHTLAKQIEEKLDAERSFILIQGLGVAHLHIKIFPAFKGGAETIDTIGPNKPEDQTILTAVQKEILT